MPINLLPQNLRKKEKKEAKKKNISQDVKLNIPKERLKKKELEKNKGGIFSNFFDFLFFSKKQKEEHKNSSKSKESVLNFKETQQKRQEVEEKLKSRKKQDKSVYRPFSHQDNIKKPQFPQPKDKGKDLLTENEKRPDVLAGEKSGFSNLFEKEVSLSDLSAVSEEKGLKKKIDNQKAPKTKTGKNQKIKKMFFWSWLFGSNKKNQERSSHILDSKSGIAQQKKKEAKKEEEVFRKKFPFNKKQDKSRELNFILEEYSGALRVAILRKFIFLLIIVIFYLSLAFFFQLFLDYNRSELEKKYYELISRNEKIKLKIVKNLKYKKEAEKLNAKLLKVQYLLDNHIYWSNLFKFLEEYTLQTVYYSNFESGGVKQITLKARTKSFEELSKQLDLFRSSDDIEKVKIDSGTFLKDSQDNESEGYVIFRVTLEFKDNFMKKK